METTTVKTSNIEVIKKFYSYLDEQNLEACAELCVPDLKGFMGSSEDPFTFESITPMVKMYYTAFPDYKHETEFMMESGEYVITRQKYTGTHKNEFMGFEPTGKHFMYKGNFIFRLSEGKIVEFWGVEDDLGMMEQLGLELHMKESLESE